jgi:hypothetical protein
VDRSLNGLLVSRKFWLAVFGVVTAIVSSYLDVPTEIWLSIETLVLAVIAGITVEDSAEKIGGKNK